MFAQLTTEQVTQGFGLPAGIVIVALVIALIFTVRLLLKAYDTINALQETRVTEANQVNNKLAAPMEDVKEINGKMYDLLLNLTSKRGR